MLDQPLDHLGVSLPEGGHQAGHLPIVLAVDIRTYEKKPLSSLNALRTCT
jgi:hypothetical protein